MFGNAINQTKSPGGIRRGLIWQSGGDIVKRVRVLHRDFFVFPGGHAAGLLIPSSMGGIWDSNYHNLNDGEVDWLYDMDKEAFQRCHVVNTLNPQTGEYEQTIDVYQDYYIKPIIYPYERDPSYPEYSFVYNYWDDSSENWSNGYWTEDPDDPDEEIWIPVWTFGIRPTISVSARGSNDPAVTLPPFTGGYSPNGVWYNRYQYFMTNLGTFSVPLYTGETDSSYVNSAQKVTGNITIHKAHLRWNLTSSSDEIVKIFNALVYHDPTILINGAPPPTP